MILPASTRKLASRCWLTARPAGRPAGRPRRCCQVSRTSPGIMLAGPGPRAGTSRRPGRRRAASARCRRRGRASRSARPSARPRRSTSPALSVSKKSSIVSTAPMVASVACTPPRAGAEPAARHPPPPPPEPPPPKLATAAPEPDDEGEFPIVPSAAIMPPKFGNGAELEKSPGATPPLPSRRAHRRLRRCRTRAGSRSARRDACPAARRRRSARGPPRPRRGGRGRRPRRRPGRASRAMSGIARGLDHLVHRARLLQRLLERPPIGLEHRPDHARAGHGPRGHHSGRGSIMTMPAAIRAPPTTSSRPSGLAG